MSTDNFEMSTLIGCCAALETGVELNNFTELSNSADDKLPSVRTSLNVQYTTNNRKYNVIETNSNYCSF